jgi:hypothetical protein
MQAYHEEMIDSDSESSSMVHFVKIDDDQFSEVNARMIAQFSLAKSLVKSTYLPQIHLENGFFLSSTVKLNQTMMFELFGEPFILLLSRKRAKHSSAVRSADNPPLLDFPSDGIESDDSAVMIGPIIGQKRKTTAVSVTPSCTTQVRRSTRCNKYDGFKPKIISDAKQVKSKVKPRKNPMMTATDGKTGDKVIVHSSDDSSNSNAPPHTPISVIQSIGVNLCGVPPEELSPKKLLANLQEADDDLA